MFRHFRLDQSEAAKLERLRRNICETPRSQTFSLALLVKYAGEWLGRPPAPNPGERDYFFAPWITIHEELNLGKTVSVTNVRFETTCLAVAIAVLSVKTHAGELLGGRPREETLAAARRAAVAAAVAEKTVREWPNRPCLPTLFETSPAFLRALRGLCESLWWYASLAKHRPGNGETGELEPRMYAAAMLCVGNAVYPPAAEFVKKCRELPEVGRGARPAPRDFRDSPKSAARVFRRPPAPREFGKRQFGKAPLAADWRHRGRGAGTRLEGCAARAQSNSERLLRPRRGDRRRRRGVLRGALRAPASVRSRGHARSFRRLRASTRTKFTTSCTTRRTTASCSSWRGRWLKPWKTPRPA